MSSYIYRVIVDGVQVGAYSQSQNILNEVERHLGRANEILVQRV
jgi:N-acetylmuramoyl-L-alanine amidase